MPLIGASLMSTSLLQCLLSMPMPLIGATVMSTLLRCLLMLLTPFVWAVQMPTVALDGFLATDVNSSLDVCHRLVNVNFSSCDVCFAGSDAQADVNSSFDVCFRCFLGSDAHAASDVSTSGNDAGWYCTVHSASYT